MTVKTYIQLQKIYIFKKIFKTFYSSNNSENIIIVSSKKYLPEHQKIHRKINFLNILKDTLKNIYMTLSVKFRLKSQNLIIR